MSADSNYDYKIIINHFHNFNYVNKICQDGSHALNKNQKKNA